LVPGPQSVFFLITETVTVLIAAAVAAMNLVDPKTLPPLADDLARQLKTHVEFLASPALAGRKPGTPGHRQAAAYITTQFSEMGLTPLPSLGSYGQLVSSDLGENLIGVRNARSPITTAPWLLIAAHYDHLGGKYLGADDNASAVAILLEAARALPSLPHHHLMFVAFTTEEPPYIRTPLMGSQYFADHLPPELGSMSAIHVAIVMDLMGGVHWTSTKDTVFAAGAEQSPELYRRLKESREPAFEVRSSKVESLTSNLEPGTLTVLPVGMHLVEEIPLLGRVSFSDYDAFRNQHVPFLFLSTGRTPRYHQPTDLPDTLHYERMAETVQWLTELTQRLDTDQARYTFVPDRIEFADEVRSLGPLIRHAADRRTMIPNTSSLSLWRMQADRDWLDKLDETRPSREDITRLERASIRMQCLLANLPGCFLF